MAHVQLASVASRLRDGIVVHTRDGQWEQGTMETCPFALKLHVAIAKP
jgi:hypothetical protein